MSQFEGGFQAAGDGALELSELLRMIGDAVVPEERRQAAIACYLSASEGWRDAGLLLGGAFAGESRGGNAAAQGPENKVKRS